jgi:hypothetical protein
MLDDKSISDAWALWLRKEDDDQFVSSEWKDN